MIHFVGAGSGAVDLITVRGQKLLEEADIVVYAGSLVNPELLKNCQKDCQIYNSAKMTLEEVMEVMISGEKQEKKVVRLHTGDPCLYGAIKEQMDLLEKENISYKVCPGVSSFCGAASALNAEYTLPGISQSVVITRMAGRTPVPEKESIESFAAHQATMVIFLSTGMLEELSKRLIEGGYQPETPAAIVYKATWEDEKVCRCKVKDLAVTAKENGIPKTAHVAMLTALENYEVKEFPMPEVGDGDILVKVEGCGICGTDAHEFKKDPFSLIPVALGHEGTGEIVKMGKNVKVDSAGKPLKVGDKVVTCMIFKDDPDIEMFDLNKKNVGGADVYGLLPDDDIHLNGWFSDYILIREGSTVFNVSDLDLKSRILIEPCAVLVHAVERAKTTGILRFNSRVVVQGCGPIGLICIAVLRTMGIENIVAVDGEQKRLDFAKKMGAEKSVNFKDFQGIDALAQGVKDAFGGYAADFAFQCTGSPVAHANIYKFIRNGGGLCELGFFINGGDATINPHFDLCSKEITLVGSWVYTLRDYATTFDFLKRAKGIGLPMDELITHEFPLEEINEAHRTNLAMEGLKIAIINK